MLARIKVVALDDCGTVVRIAEHTFGQLEAFAKARVADAANAAPDEIQAAEKAVRQFVCDALNNAAGDLAWTVDSIRQDMGPETFRRLFEAAIQHDGLAAPKEAGPDAEPGERQAA